MTRIETLEKIVRQDGSCKGIACDNCPLTHHCTGDSLGDLQLAKEMLAKEKETMKKFRLEDYKGNFVMHVRLEKEYNTFCKFLDDHGQTWDDEDSYLTCIHWGTYGDHFCFDFNDGSYCSFCWFKDHNYTILEFSDFDWSECEFTKGQEVEVSDDGEDFGRDWGKKFYEYKPELEKPFLTIDMDGDINNWKYCRAIQPKYKPYTQPRLEWIRKAIKYNGETLIIESISTRKSTGEWIIKASVYGWFNLETMLDKFTWGDNSKCGVLNET